MRKLLIFLTTLFVYVNNIIAKDIIMADFSKNKINIDVGFNGAKLLFFGVIDDEGDVVVSVTGPRESIKVRKKKRKLGLWINTDFKTFYDVPSYYFVASTKPLDQLNANEALRINQIGIKNIRFEGAEEEVKKDRDLWKSGIIDTMIKLGRYTSEQGSINISKQRLFKTELNFSSEIIDGEYIVDTLLIKEGNVIAVKRSFINVSKYGLGEKIYTMATEKGLIYGILAVFFALVFGFTVNETIRRFNA